MKLYCVRVEITRWADVHVVAESKDAANTYALDNADDIISDCTCDDDAEVSASEATGGWEPGELPYLTDAAKDAEAKIVGGESDCETWAAAIASSAPVVDTRTIPLALRYEDGREERVASVPLSAPGGAR